MSHDGIIIVQARPRQRRRGIAIARAGRPSHVMATPVTVTYDDLAGGRVDSNAIESAFGPDGLGIIAVRGVPGIVEQRGALLPLIATFAALPDAVKDKYVDVVSTYNIGWSHGREAMSTGKPDLAKGSYYFNAVADRPVDDDEAVRQWPTFCTPNVWPDEELPDLRHAAMGLARTIIDVGALVAAACDKLTESRAPGIEHG